MYRTISAAALLALAAAASAQSPPPGGQREEQTVTVEGRRQAITQALRQMVQPGSSGQLARFETALCPKVFGYPPEWAATVERMVRDNSEALGAGKTKPRCDINAVIIFINEPKRLVNALAEAEPGMLSKSPAERQHFLSRDRAVYSWHVSDLRNKDGQPVAQAEQMFGAPSDAYVVRNSGFHSRLYTNVREDMRLAFVVIDIAQTEGKRLRQLADLATMHLLLDVRPEAAGADRSSILSLFEARAEGEQAPRTLSAFDRSAIRGFYSLKEMNRSEKQQRRAIADKMVKEKAR